MALRKKKPPKRLPKPTQPDAIERSYERLIGKYVKALEEEATAEFKKLLPDLRKQANDARKGIRLDAINDDVEKVIEKIMHKLSKRFPTKMLGKWSLATVVSVSRLGKRNLKKQTEDVLEDGLNFSKDKELNDYLQDRVSENVGLIESIPEENLLDVKKLIMREINNDTPVSKIQKLISKQFDKSKGRARLIARDQVNKLNGQIAQYRQREILGANEYIWRTSKDERVRGRPGGKWAKATPSHWDREGKKYKWDNPPEGGHPGEAIQCRCWPEPVLDDLES